MRKYISILVLFVTCFVQGQHLANFYLEPTADDNVIIVHTEFRYFHGAGLNEYGVTITDNVIDFTLCYTLGSTTSETYDIQEFEVTLPSGYSNFTFNMLFSTMTTGSPCNYDDPFFSDSIDFPFPYNPTATTAVPDENFEGFLEAKGFGDGISNNGLVFTHRIEHVTWLQMDLDDVVDYGLGAIANLSGIETMTRLRTLWARDHVFTFFNPSQYPELRQLWIGSEFLTGMDLSNNPILESLEVYSDQPITITPINSPLLSQVEIEGNGIETINLTQNPNVLYLNVINTNISELNLSGNTLIENLRVDNNNTLLSLDLSQNENLVLFFCKDNEVLNSLVLGSSLDLNGLDCSNNALTHLDVSQCTNLETLVANNNELETLDLSNNDNLSLALLGNNNLYSLDLRTGNSGITTTTMIATNNGNPFCVDVDNSLEAPYQSWSFDSWVVFDEDCGIDSPIPITDLNFLEALANSNVVDNNNDGIGDVVADTNNDGLIQESEAEVVSGLVVSGFGIQSLQGIEYFPNLEALIADNNDIELVNLMYNEGITWLSLNNNILNSIDVSTLLGLEQLWLDGNMITDIDVIQNDQLQSFRCAQNNLINLLMNNGNNTNIQQFNTSQNPNLSCIQVDDVAFSEGNPNWIKDDTSSYSENCLLGVFEGELNVPVTLFPNPTTGKVYLESQIPVEVVEVYTILGKRVMLLEEGALEFDLSTLQAGVYFIKVLDFTQKSVIKKVVKQ